MSKFFQDKTDLRLSARLIFQNIFLNSKDKLFTSLISLKHGLIALFGNSFSCQKLSNLRDIVIEEASKIYNNINVVPETEAPSSEKSILLPFPVDEALFVNIAQRIYSQILENDQANESPPISVAECFIEELIKTEISLHQHQETKNFNEKNRFCISKETFLHCACTCPSVIPLMTSRETASTMWQSLIDCEKILLKTENKTKSCFFHRLKQEEQQREEESSSSSLKPKRVSFPFLTVDGNKNEQEQKQEEDFCRCVSTSTILRCFSLGGRLQ
jgi:hypothetical protein